MKSPDPSAVVGDQLPILVVEDDPDDALLLKMALAKAGAAELVHFVNSGEKAIEYLEGAIPISGRTLCLAPRLILLDLKIPPPDGFGLLGWLRQRPVFNSVRRVVLSGSTWPADIERAYALGADSYITKPVGFAHLVLVAERLRQECLWPGCAPQFHVLRPPSET